jgi:hypothetical protein
MRMRAPPLSLVLLTTVACSSSLAPRTTAVVPVERDGRYVFEFANQSLAIDPRVGARITSFALDGQNVLSGPEVNALNYGSTFWSGPQSDWDWPPPAELDREPYQASIEGARLVLRSQASPSLEVRLTKKVSVDAAAAAVDIEYVIENLARAPRRFSPWQVTRVPVEGVSFFPTGAREYGSGPFHALAGVQRGQPYTWFQFDPAASHADEQELFADGAGGFIAHAARGLVLVQSFADEPPTARAPGEAEIEIFLEAAADPAARYIELEVQGAYVTIAPGASSSWRVRWYLRHLPAGTSATIDAPGLANFVTHLLDDRSAASRSP